MRVVAQVVVVLILVGVVDALNAAHAAEDPWGLHPLRKIPIAYRHDGFSIFFNEPPMPKERLLDLFVNPLANTNAAINVWGVGPGSVFCYDTKVGEVFGEGLTPEQRDMVREGDRWVHQNVMDLISAGHDPMRVAIERGHEIGIKTFCRLEMNHEYGPASDDNWLWVALVGSFNKKHPEYRIGKSVLLDFKHEEVRGFKLAIFRECLEAGADGLSMDFAVYPPFFEDPEAGLPIMTQFVHDVRALCNEFAQAGNRPIELMARVPARNAPELGLDWKTWMEEGLIDYIVPTHYRPNETFDINVDEFISMGNRTGTNVYPCIWQVLGFVSTDQMPDDEESGRRRYDKPKTKEMFYTQALLYHRAGADGIQLGFSEDQWRLRPYLNDLADPAKMELADKHYMVDVLPHCPIQFPLPDAAPFTCEKIVPLRLADDIAKAQDVGYDVNATMVLYASPMQPGDALSIYVNGRGPATVSADESAAKDASSEDPPLDARKVTASGDVFNKEWWRRGELRLSVPAEWWRLGQNEIRFAFSSSAAQRERPFYITWVDLLLDYRSED